jgi:hypothetical protein
MRCVDVKHFTNFDKNLMLPVLSRPQRLFGSIYKQHQKIAVSVSTTAICHVVSITSTKPQGVT